MTKKILILSALLMLVPAICAAQGTIKVNDTLVNPDTELNIYKDELVGGKITIEFIPDSEVSSVEISLNRGLSWEKMEADNKRFIYKHRASAGDELGLSFLIEHEDGSIKTYSPYIIIIYNKMRPRDLIIELLSKLERYYEQENKSSFLRLFSSSFPNRTEFDESIQNDFTNFNNIRLFSKIERLVFSQDLTMAQGDVFFERRYTTSDGSNRTNSGIIKILFEKDGSKWLIASFKNNNVFGSTLIALKPDIVINNADVTISDGTASYEADVDVVVRNNGDAIARNIVVDYYKRDDDGGETVFTKYATRTITKINPKSQFTIPTISLDTAPQLGGNHSFAIKADPNDRIEEISDANNIGQNSAFINF
ncbi:CARDB domain-containing protein [Candidatus Omnitrophota bacterium]